MSVVRIHNSAMYFYQRHKFSLLSLSVKTIKTAQTDPTVKDIENRLRKEKGALAELCPL